MKDRREYYRNYQKMRRANPEVLKKDIEATKKWYRGVKQQILRMRERNNIMTRYAEGTKITPERSQVEVQAILKKYGATDVASGEQNGQAVIGFKYNRKLYKIILPYPDIDDFRMSGSRARTRLQQQTAKDQEIRRLWRALILVIKAKLEATQSGIVTFEQEFLSHMVVNEQGQTMHEWAKPFLDSNKMLQLPPIREEE